MEQLREIFVIKCQKKPANSGKKIKKIRGKIKKLAKKGQKKIEKLTENSEKLRWKVLIKFWVKLENDGN